MKILLKRKYFTLIELITSLAILSVLIIAGIQFFLASQKAWTQGEMQREIFENARIALDLISRDLESAYYGDGVAPFWHWKGNANWNEFSNELIAFVADTPIPMNDYSTTNLCEIKYQLYSAENTADEDFGWIRRSITGNKNDDNSDNLKWNFFNNTKVGYTTSVSSGAPSAAFTANAASSGEDNTDPDYTVYSNIIPHVLDLSFTCDTDTDMGTVLNPDTTASTSPDACTASEFPKVVIVSITLMDRNSWQKWVSLLNAGDINENSFRIENQRTFSKIIHLQDRGQ